MEGNSSDVTFDVIYVTAFSGADVEACREAGDEINQVKRVRVRKRREKEERERESGEREREREWRVRERAEKWRRQHC